MCLSLRRIIYEIGAYDTNSVRRDGLIFEETSERNEVSFYIGEIVRRARDEINVSFLICFENAIEATLSCLILKQFGV